MKRCFEKTLNPNHSKMGKYIITNRATQDLEEIWDYGLNIWSLNQSIKYVREITKDFNTISQSNYIGTEYYEVLEGLKSYGSTSHSIFFRVVDRNTIEILRVLPRQMELDNIQLMKTNLNG